MSQSWKQGDKNMNTENVFDDSKLNIQFENYELLSPKNAVAIDSQRDINIYETLCKYCADNNIDLTNISDAEFDKASNSIERYKNNVIKNNSPLKTFLFWI